MSYPKIIFKGTRPPIKTQGTKIKLIQDIARFMQWSGDGTYYEPFLGSGAVLFSLNPENAVVGDNNPYIIALYASMQSGLQDYTPDKVYQYLVYEGQKLVQTPDTTDSYYYEIRDRFNREHYPLDYLLLNRTCFNGINRFNSKGEFNTPFCRIPERFINKAFITKVMKQYSTVYELIHMHKNSWEFIVTDWSDIVASAGIDDYIFLDPPYFGLNTQYYSKWSLEDFEALESACTASKAQFMLTMWLDKYYIDRYTGEQCVRHNDWMDTHWQYLKEVTVGHKYTVGQQVSSRNAVIEVLRQKVN